MKITTFENKVENFLIVQKAIEQNIRCKENFEVRETTYSVQILFREQAIKYIYSFDYQNFSVLGKISKFKGHLNKLPESFFIENEFEIDVQYFRFADKIHDLENTQGVTTSFDNVIEIDITAAYFYTALQMGVIDEPLFNEIMYLKKTDEQGNKIYRCKGDRLRILGSMATRTLVTKYENGLQSGEVEVETNEKFRTLWFSICKKVDLIFTTLVKQISKDDFLFYFVDGIYLHNTPETVSQVISAFEKNNLPYKSILIDSFGVTNKNNRLVIHIKKSNGKEKKFAVPYREIKYYTLS